MASRLTESVPKSVCCDLLHHHNSAASTFRRHLRHGDFRWSRTIPVVTYVLRGVGPVSGSPTQDLSHGSMFSFFAHQFEKARMNRKPVKNTNDIFGCHFGRTPLPLLANTNEFPRPRCKLLQDLRCCHNTPEREPSKYDLLPPCKATDYNYHKNTPKDSYH